MITRRSVVRTSGLIARKGRPALWAFGYPDLARLFGMREGAVREAVRSKRFDPTDLESVVAFAVKRQARRPR